MITSPLPSLIRSLSRPLEPIPTGQAPVLPALSGIRAVVFDIYGTLVISGSGDIGVTEDVQKEAALRSILREFAIEPPAPPGGQSLTGHLMDLIRAHHARAHTRGIDYPEVEIREIWQELLGLEPGPTLEAVAVSYECATNPVWPMPGARELLADLHRRSCALGIVSNAQFYTPLLFEAFFAQSLDQLGFDSDLSWFSYQEGRAKPGTWLYERLADALASQSIAPAEVLYLGNDALKDIHPAATLGFRTALFAGDQRSLRLRHGEGALHPPDAVVTDLSQVGELLA